MYTDMMDPKAIRVVGYGSNPFDWPVAVELIGLNLVDGEADPDGLQPLFHRDEMNTQMPPVRPPGFTGDIQYTFWPVYYVDGQWTTFPALEFWGDQAGTPRIGTGRLINNWRNWCYWVDDAATKGYAPTLGDPFGYFLTAGDQRRMDVWNVRRRSNIWFGTLQWGSCPATMPQVPAPTPTPTPVPPTHQPPAPVPSPTPGSTGSTSGSGLMALELERNQTLADMLTTFQLIRQELTAIREALTKSL